jgi:DNA-binding Xre family transcriptional regulator
LQNCKENADMDVCYNKLFKLLIDKSMKKTEFRKAVGISQNTLAKLSNNENVSMNVLVKICRTLNCTVDDILDITPSQNDVHKNRVDC